MKKWLTTKSAIKLTYSRMFEKSTLDFGRKSIGGHALNDTYILALFTKNWPSSGISDMSVQFID